MSKPKNDTKASEAQTETQNSDPQSTDTQSTDEQNPDMHNADGQNSATAPDSGTLSTAPPASPESPASKNTPRDTHSVTQNENALLPLAELAQLHRVPTWQQAALHRLMGWEDGKQVTDAEYQAGLDKLSGRRMGGM